MTRWLPTLAALAIVTGSGVVHGLWSGRWSPSRVMEARVAGLRRVPEAFGDWKGTDLTLDARTLQVADLAGYLMRRYQNRKGDAVTVLLVCGRPGPVAVHTPEVCYPGNGFEQVAPAEKVAVSPGAAGPADAFWSVDFRKPSASSPEEIRTLYSWTAGGPWTTSGNPRVDFAGEPALFKLYVVRPKGPGAPGVPPGPDDPGLGFVRAFLPELRKCLFAPRG